MRTEKIRLEAEFAPETRFEVAPVINAPLRGSAEAELEQVKNRLLAEWSAQSSPAVMERLRWAAGEAASLAWLTPFPLLVFPSLFEERASAALDQLARQQSIRVRSRATLIGAAMAGCRVVSGQGRRLKPVLLSSAMVLAELKRQMESLQKTTNELLTTLPALPDAMNRAAV